MSVKIMSWVWDNSPYEGKQLLIHLALADWAGDNGICWPKQQTIAKKCRCSTETVRATTRKMQSDGLLKIVHESTGPGSSHMYMLTNPAVNTPDDLPQMNRAIPQVDGPNTPNPSPNNHQEPSRTISNSPDDLVARCPYCRKALKGNGAHKCSAMNMNIK